MAMIAFLIAGCDLLNHATGGGGEDSSTGSSSSSSRGKSNSSSEGQDTSVKIIFRRQTGVDLNGDRLIVADNYMIFPIS